ncbi:NAD(P)H:quinone oxidoreductase [Edaphobacter bradus]|uniref:NAD(P)H:quinone oxidoreductase n=1 Tax=Edaphobacter bradus TaxID=2259016 RepID=UPI0021DFB22E|nr:NAD(P)H:quinone oxidoreductase [Edaphobacter bradus]
MKVLVVYYSMYGHVHALANAVVAGAQQVAGVDVVFRRIREFPENVEHMKKEGGYAYQVYQGQQSIPECTLDDLRAADGMVFGSPTRYGNMTAQAKALIDSTASLWLGGDMEGKPVGFFTSTASTHGGQETTLVSMMFPLLHLGMLIVGVPYSLPGMIHTEARGGTPYGASTIAGPRGELQPTAEDLAIATSLGKRVAEVTLAVRAKK